jgi:hypothetical protein
MTKKMSTLWTTAAAAFGLAGFVLLFGAAGSSAFAQSAVLASAEYSADPDLRCDLLEVRRVSGGTLTIRWRVVNGSSAAGGGLTPTAEKIINYSRNWEEYFFIDPAQNKKYLVLTDSANTRIGDVTGVNLGRGASRGMWAKFAAPPATSTKVSVTIAGFPPFEDIPISQ